MLSRRGLIAGLFAAPVIVRPGILMPVRPIIAVPKSDVGVVTAAPTAELAVKINALLAQMRALGLIAPEYGNG